MAERRRAVAPGAGDATAPDTTPPDGAPPDGGSPGAGPADGGLPDSAAPDGDPPGRGSRDAPGPPETDPPNLPPETAPPASEGGGAVPRSARSAGPALLTEAGPGPGSRAPRAGGRRGTGGTAGSAAAWPGPDRDTRELREALEALRAVLESRPGPSPARGRHRCRCGPRWLPVGVVALLGIGLALVLPRATDDDSLGAPAVPRSSSPHADPDDVPRPKPPVPMRWPGGPVTVPPGVPRDGPGVDAPGTDLTIAFDVDGRRLDVFERVSFPRPRTDVRLRLPSLGAVTGPRTAVPVPSVQHLQVELDGRPAVAEPGPAGAWTARTAGDGVMGVVLRYQVDGSVLRLPGSPADRILAVIPSLTGEDNLRDGLPVTVRISDRRVVGLSCLPGSGDGTDAAATMCAAPEGRTWTAQLPLGGAALALVQANLPV